MLRNERFLLQNGYMVKRNEVFCQQIDYFCKRGEDPCQWNDNFCQRVVDYSLRNDDLLISLNRSSTLRAKISFPVFFMSSGKDFY